MSNKSLVSIITIFLNGEQFIEDAIESAIAQTYKNWELLLVDDGSSSSSRQSHTLEPACPSPNAPAGIDSHHSRHSLQ
jgi:hypothetical protein